MLTECCSLKPNGLIVCLLPDANIACNRFCFVGRYTAVNQNNVIVGQSGNYCILVTRLGRLVDRMSRVAFPLVGLALT